jgi:glycosyltransferase involved in cell wall biosynthesis
LEYNDIKPDQWVETSYGKVFYLSEKQPTKVLRQLLNKENVEAVYINSLFHFRFSIIPVLTTILARKKVKIVLHPRGELNEGALKIKPVRKKIFLFLINLFKIYRNIGLQATSQEEKKNIVSKIHSSKRVDIIPNVCRKMSFLQREKRAGELRICYLSRISPIKNLDILIDAVFSLVHGNITFDIIGPISDKQYWERCQSKIAASPTNIRINYVGSVHPDKIEELLGNYHLFALLTSGENYGHAIIEAMMTGLPVMISDRTPWKNINERKCGFVAPLEEPGIYSGFLKQILGFEQAKYNEWSQNSHKYAKEQLPVTDDYCNKLQQMFSGERINEAR